MSVEVEIYMTNLTKFFRNNPKDLLSLIPQDKEEIFFKKVREAATNNVEKGLDVTLTQKQLIQICVDLNTTKKSDIKVVDKIYQDTKFGKICLN